MHFPNTMQKHILAYEQVKEAQSEKKEEEVPKVKVLLEETKDEEVTKEAIMAMFVHCNVVELDTETSVMVQGKEKVRDVGKPILPCIFEETSHYGLCDLGTAINVISYGFYLEIQEELEPATLANTDMTIMLADKTLIIPMGVVENATVTIGNNNFPINFVVVDMPTDTLCPIVFGRNFLNDIGAKVDFRQEIISLKLGKAKKKFHFSKFKDTPFQKQEEKEKEKTIEEVGQLVKNRRQPSTWFCNWETF